MTGLVKLNGHVPRSVSFSFPFASPTRDSRLRVHDPKVRLILVSRDVNGPPAQFRLADEFVTYSLHCWSFTSLGLLLLSQGLSTGSTGNADRPSYHAATPVRGMMVWYLAERPVLPRRLGK